MSKNIVFCADGTWDSPVKNSNVCQIYNALPHIDGVQVVHYDDGVGADGTPFERLFGGAIGAGLFQKIKDGYQVIANQYQPGDRIYLLGFSRGAYTARSLAGMIAICGLPTVNQSDPQCVGKAFTAYREVGERENLLKQLNTDYRMYDAPLEFVGVWDTVGSLGIPALFGGVDEILCGFLDTSCHPDVKYAAQALAIDERRLQFQAAPWSSPPAAGQTIAQCWFAGVHCDVGGGYTPDAGGAALSNVPFLWIAHQAEQCGIQFTPGALPNPVLPASANDALATLHDSRTGVFIASVPLVRKVPLDAAIASSVQHRCQAGDYAPENLKLSGGALAATYKVMPV